MRGRRVLATACKVEGCDRPGRYRRGLCNTHYARWWKTGCAGGAESLRPSHVTAHGTVNEYSNYGCRCEECKAAMAERNESALKSGTCVDCGAAIWRTGPSRQRCRPCNARAHTLPIEERHGTEVGYSKGCRCSDCIRAATDARRARRRRDLAASNAYDRDYRRRRKQEAA